MSKSVVVKSKLKSEHNITAWVHDTGTGMGMKLDDYLLAMSHEIGNPTFLLTKGQMLQKMKEASAVIEAEMHEATVMIPY